VDKGLEQFERGDFIKGLELRRSATAKALIIGSSR
jgi:hypothetical protein